jgi:hypothetical protein
MDNSPKLRYEAHQKHEGHNRKSTRLSVLAGKLRFVSLPSSRLDKVVLLSTLCSLFISNSQFTKIKNIILVNVSIKVDSQQNSMSLSRAIYLEPNYVS